MGEGGGGGGECSEKDFGSKNLEDIFIRPFAHGFLTIRLT